MENTEDNWQLATTKRNGALGLVMCLAKIWGLWPKRQEKSSILRNLLLPLGGFLGYINVIAGSYNLKYIVDSGAFTQDNMFHLISAIATTSFLTIVLAFVTARNSLLNLVTSLFYFDCEMAKLPNFYKNNKRTKIITVLILLMAQSSLLYIRLWRSLYQKPCHEKNRLYNLTVVCGLIINIKYPFDISRFSWKQAVLAPRISNELDELLMIPMGIFFAVSSIIMAVIELHIILSQTIASILLPVILKI